MDRKDLDNLNLEEEVKEKLCNSNMDTVEKISTNYLENMDSEEIRLAQDEVFKTYTEQFCEHEEEENNQVKEEINEEQLESSKSMLSELYNVDSSDNESNDNIVSDASNSCLPEDPTYDDSSDSVDSHGYRSQTCTDDSILLNQSPSVQSTIGNAFRVLRYSTLMKRRTCEPTVYKTESRQLNELLGGGLESQKVYYFYGADRETNRSIVMNFLVDIMIHDLTKKLKTLLIVHYERYGICLFLKIKEKKERLRPFATEEGSADCYFYPAKANTTEDLFSLLGLLQNAHRPETNDPVWNDFQAVAIFNYSEVTEELRASSPYASLNLLRELKNIAYHLNIVVLLFDAYRNQGSIEKVAMHIGDPRLRLNEQNAQRNQSLQQSGHKEETEESMELSDQEGGIVVSQPIQNYEPSSNNEQDLNENNDKDENVSSDHALSINITDHINPYYLAIVENWSDADIEQIRNEAAENNRTRDNNYFGGADESNLGEHEMNDMIESLNQQPLSYMRNIRTLEAVKKNKKLYLEKKSIQKHKISEGERVFINTIIEMENFGSFNDSIIRFTLLKSQNQMEYTFCLARLKDDFICDI